jgi:hypothetical protein
LFFENQNMAVPQQHFEKRRIFGIASAFSTLYVACFAAEDDKHFLQQTMVPVVSCQKRYVLSIQTKGLPLAIFFLSGDNRDIPTSSA